MDLAATLPAEAAELPSWSTAILTIVIGVTLSTLFLRWFAGEDDPVPLAVGLDRERKKLLPLILPDGCVRVVRLAARSDSPVPYFRSRASVQILMDWVSGARTPWSTLEFKMDDGDMKPNRSNDGDAKANRSFRPLLVLVNSRSGGKQGVELLRNFRHVLHYTQAVDLREEGPQAALQWWSRTGLRYRVLVCGGDGTVGWVLSCLDALQPEYVPPVAILPLGTGNDLARVLGWGSGFGGSSILAVLDKVSQAHAAHLDRWQVVCRDVLPEGRPSSLDASGLQRKTVMMYNYFGIGVDAAVALDFHNMRERSPHLFFSRLANKVLYVKAGIAAAARSGMANFSLKACKNLSQKITLECDGEEVEVPPKVEGIVVLNIGSFGGGCDLWGSPATEGDDSDSDLSSDDSTRSLSQLRPSMRDKKLEVVGVHGSFQLGAAHVGLYHATKLAQASHVRITSKEALPAQVDGEPWLFARNGTIDITWKSQALMLARHAAVSHAVATDVIDWALDQKIIDLEQRNQLMSEIARRAQKRSLHRGGSGIASNSGSNFFAQ